jgi:hypothetical protein
MLNIQDTGIPIAFIQSDNKAHRKIVSIAGKKDPVNQGYTEIALEGEDKFVPVMNPDKERSIWYVTGESGSGKSYYCASIIEKYKQMFPENEVYLFSPFDEDSSIDRIKGIKKINLEKFKESESTFKDFVNSLVIFDDCEDLADKKLGKEIMSLFHQILTCGRKMNVTCIFTSHMPCAGHQTKKILMESTSITWFPNTLQARAKKYLLETYIGLNKEQIKKLDQVESRFVCWVKGANPVLITEQAIFVLKEF